MLKKLSVEHRSLPIAFDPLLATQNPNFADSPIAVVTPVVAAGGARQRCQSALWSESGVGGYWKDDHKARGRCNCFRGFSYCRGRSSCKQNCQDSKTLIDELAIS